MSIVAHEEFWARTRRAEDAGVGADGCWVWTGAQLRGQPRCPAEVDLGKERYARRAAWRAAGLGDIPAGSVLVPACGNKLCVRPGDGHLEVRTRAEAAAAQAKAGRVGRAARFQELPQDQQDLRTRLRAAAAERSQRRQAAREASLSAQEDRAQVRERTND